MLRIACDTLLRVHDHVFDALSTPPAPGADRQLVYTRWDVPHILNLERLEVPAENCRVQKVFGVLEGRRAAGACALRRALNPKPTSFTWSASRWLQEVDELPANAAASTSTSGKSERLRWRRR